jgi:hypothetical protein
MATGRLGAVDLTAATDTLLYTVPAGTFTVATVSIVNRSNSAITVRVGVSTSATTIGVTDFIEYETELMPKGVLERTGLVLDAAKSLLVRSSTANVTAMAFGIETPTS